MLKLHNHFLQIAPVERKTLLPGEATTYNEIGIVLAKDETITDIELGAKVRFDRFLAYKFPREGSEDEYDWFVKYSEIISSDTSNITHVG
jgi:hypothetical protein